MIDVSRGRVVRLLGFSIFFLAVLSVLGQFCKYYLGHPSVFGLVDLFDLSLEKSVPNYFSTLLLVLCSLLAGILAVLAEKRGLAFKNHWKGLCFVFLYMSVDENVSIHELTMKPLREIFHLTGYFYFAWVVLGIIFVVSMAIIYSKFVFKLPKRIRGMVILAGFIYVSGVIGAEMLQAPYAARHEDALITIPMGHVEELMEMSGILIFINALLLLIQSTQGPKPLEINVTD